MSDMDERSRLADLEFAEIAFSAGFGSPVSSRFWFFADRFDGPTPTGGFASFGATGWLGQNEEPPKAFHNLNAAVRMERAGWLDLIRVVAQNLQLTKEEIETILKPAAEGQ